MELKTFLLGLSLSIISFAAKTGLGWAYYYRSASVARRIAMSLLLAGLYALIFLGAYFFVSSINLLEHFDTLIPLWENGYMLHWMTALFMLLWGGLLIRRTFCPAEQPHSRGWLVLVLPCPVCASMILISVAMVQLHFPREAFPATISLFFIFIFSAFFVGWIAMLKKPDRNLTQETDLGLSMIMIALYFLLLALVGPHFKDLDKIYRLAVQAFSDGQSRSVFTDILAYFLILTGIWAGFIYTQKRIRS